MQDDTRSISSYCHYTVKTKRVSYFCWFYYNFRDMGETKCTLCANVYLTMMRILYILCFILKFHLSFFFSPILNQWFLGIFCHNVLKQWKNYIKFDFQYQSTPRLEVAHLPLHQSSKHLTSEKYQGSADRGNLDLKSEVNRPSSSKLQQWATIYSQC